MRTITADQARRLMLTALGFAAPRPARADARAIRRVIDRLSVLQIDSVNVLARAHYVPLFSRLGPYAMPTLDRLAYGERALFEYWAHAASLIDIDLFPALRWRMHGDDRPGWGRFKEWGRRNSSIVEAIYDEVAQRGPLGVSELSERDERSGPWWGWGSGKTALEYLFWSGRLSVAGRRNFERLYDVTERVIPRAVLDVPALARDDAHRVLLARAARALGVATAADLADYFWIPKPAARSGVADLVARGELEPVDVDGWPERAYVVPGARVPRTVEARALVSPFDPLLWERRRVQRTFGFEYRIEIYVPEHKRVHGYYVLPFLLDDRLVARVDLKADRTRRTLLVRAAHLEPGADRARVARGLAAELRAVAAWLALDDIVVERRGDLAPALRAAM